MGPNFGPTFNIPLKAYPSTIHCFAPSKSHAKLWTETSTVQEKNKEKKKNEKNDEDDGKSVKTAKKKDAKVTLIRKQTNDANINKRPNPYDG